MHFFRRKPGHEALQAALEPGAPAPNVPFDLLSAPCPAGFRELRTTGRVGQGAGAFSMLRDDLLRLGVFEHPWVFADRQNFEHVQVRHIAHVCTFHFGFWSAHPIQISTINEIPRNGEQAAIDLQIVTLDGHAAAGAESFRLWQRDDDEVHAQVWSRSRPADLLTTLASPWFRAQQKKFGRAVLQRAQALVDER